jgi:hypothetical protein
LLRDAVPATKPNPLEQRLNGGADAFQRLLDIGIGPP